MCTCTSGYGCGACRSNRYSYQHSPQFKRAQQTMATRTLILSSPHLTPDEVESFIWTLFGIQNAPTYKEGV